MLRPREQDACFVQTGIFNPWKPLSPKEGDFAPVSKLCGNTLPRLLFCP